MFLNANNWSTHHFSTIIIGSPLFLQIGNVAILLERGDETDHYDYLDLFVRRWRREAIAIKQDCIRRNYTASSTPSLRQTENRAREDRIAKISTPDMPTEIVDTGYFSREFQPYDWYKKTNTEVRVWLECFINT
jgi:hypothetical protein